jgi:hypothetical protein
MSEPMNTTTKCDRLVITYQMAYVAGEVESRAHRESDIWRHGFRLGFYSSYEIQELPEMERELFADLRAKYTALGVL